MMVRAGSTGREGLPHGHGGFGSAAQWSHYSESSHSRGHESLTQWLPGDELDDS